MKYNDEALEIGHKVCNRCKVDKPLTEFYLVRRSEKEGGTLRWTYCKDCNKAAVKKRRKKLKVLAVEHMGGSCWGCGYKKCLGALEFHHRDPSKKDFGIGKGDTKSWKRVEAELEKCVMVCANCHREIHDGMIPVPERPK